MNITIKLSKQKRFECPFINRQGHTGGSKVHQDYINYGQKDQLGVRHEHYYKTIQTKRVELPFINRQGHTGGSKVLHDYINYGQKDQLGVRHEHYYKTIQT